jgi:hypothetical protein
MLFQQLHASNGHATVDRFAHVINGEQGHLYSGERFHFHAGLAVGLHGGGAGHMYCFKVICATSRLVGWTKFGQENLPKSECTLAIRLQRHDAMRTIFNANRRSVGKTTRTKCEHLGLTAAHSGLIN